MRLAREHSLAGGPVLADCPKQDVRHLIKFGQSCQTNLQTGIVNADDDSGTSGNPPSQIDTGSVCPIAGRGVDAQTKRSSG